MAEHVDRTGLYIMVFIILLYACRNARRTAHIAQQVQEIHAIVVGVDSLAMPNQNLELVEEQGETE